MELDRLISDERVGDNGAERGHRTSHQTAVSQSDNSIEAISSETPNKQTTPEDAQEKRTPRVPTAQLRRSGHVIWLVLIYSTLAVFAWVVFCILTKHPVTATRSYSVDFDRPHAYGWTGANVIHSFYQQNENWLQAAQVIQSIVAVLTIPLTSAVCSKAAVAFVQQSTRSNLTLRQTMVLADRGWTDPLLYLKMLAGGFKRYGTTFLVGATLLNILGGVLAPLQAYFISTETIKTSTFPDMLVSITDIADQFKSDLGDYNLLPVMARSAMTASDLTSPQGRLWTEDSVDCTESLKKSESKPLPLSCVYGLGNTLNNLTQLPNPFLAQLPSGYSTGLIRQYLLRVNSTAHRDIVSEDEYPANCETLPGAFFARYGAINPNIRIMTGWGNWSMEACMPANLSISPWKATQELYLNISLGASGPGPWEYYSEPQEEGGLFKITLATTAGFFELPNYMNGQKSGPLLEGSPVDLCGGDCTQQASSFTPDPDAANTTSRMRRQDSGDLSITPNSSLALEQSRNRGPLATIALALFGTGSFVAERMRDPSGFMYPNQTYEEYVATPNAGACVGQAPLMGLLQNNGNNQIGNFIDPCLKNDIHTHDDVQRQVVNFMRALYYNHYDGYRLGDGSVITNAFTAAAFLANELWLLSSTDPGRHSWGIQYDRGADTLVPVISDTGIIVVSALLGLFITCLLLLAAYSALTPRWTDQLDAFAILRLGASLADQIPLRISHRPGDVSVLDTLPGGLGDATDGKGPVGELSPGAQRSLTGGRKYAAYDDKLR